MGIGVWGRTVQAEELACAKGQRYGVFITSGILKVTLESSSVKHLISP